MGGGGVGERLGGWIMRTMTRALNLNQREQSGGKSPVELLLVWTRGAPEAEGKGQGLR